MPIERVVVNASPLITLFHSGQADLLPQLFGDIVVPEMVWQEVAVGGQDDPAAQALAHTPWLHRVAIDVSPRIAVWNLDDGESSVLTFALRQLDYRAVIDDQAARRCARTLGIRTLGTGGVLVLAKRRGLIESVEMRLRRLRDAGLWLSDEVLGLLLKEAGE
jgi:predicted nucleic acid-binding protein